MKTYNALAALLSYPTGELVGAIPELRAVLDREALLAPGARAALDALLTELETQDLYDLEERYVALFDRVRSLSLHLFEHVHGESRDRGQAMVHLNALYARNGCTLVASELPDFIPAFLEFLSCLPPKEAAARLAQTGEILAGIAARLAARGSRYAAVFEALLALAGYTGARKAVPDAQIRAEDDPASLDATWVEEPAFGGGIRRACAPPVSKRPV